MTGPKGQLQSGRFRGAICFTWDKFVENFGREMRIAGEVFEGLASKGLKEGSLCCFDFTFVSNRRENLARLRQFLQSSLSLFDHRH